MKCLRLILALVAVAVTTVACGPKPLPTSTPDAEFIRDMPLRKIVREHTRRGAKLRGWDTAIEVYAIYEGWEYRRKIIDERTEARKWNAEKVAEVTERHRNEFDTNISFVFSVYGSERDWVDMDRKRPIWVPFMLLPDGSHVEPTSVKEISLPADEVRDAYPFLTIWQKQYRVVYPRTHLETGELLAPVNADSLTVEFSSILGRSMVSWEFVPPDAL